MGYSVTAAAANSEREMLRVLTTLYPVWATGPATDNGPLTNGWARGGREYFAEATRETREDGSATGAVYRVKGETATRVGSYRVGPEGWITRWSGSTEALRERAERNAGVRR